MFDSSKYPKSLDEETFDDWLESGRSSLLGYSHLLIIWNEFEVAYQPVYVEHRDKIQEYEHYQTATGRETLIAAYDLYSESRVV
ncbi:MAG: hypothetical protein RIG62_13330 [Cyclobacteriaceae bacterium]